MKLLNPLKKVFGSNAKHKDTSNGYVGMFVRSECGRDGGTYNIVLFSDKDRNFVHIANGSNRKVENPKRKKIKHLSLTGDFIPDEYISDKKANVTNGKARSLITQYCQGINENEDHII